MKIKSPNYTSIMDLFQFTLVLYFYLTIGGTMHVICGIVLYSKLAGITVGYTITSSTSLAYVITLKTYLRLYLTYHVHLYVIKLQNYILAMYTKSFKFKIDLYFSFV